MTEDAPPNERPSNQKGAAIPVIHAALSSSLGSFQHGRGSFVQRGRRMSHYPGYRLNHPNSSYNNTQNTSHHMQFEPLPKRPNDYPPDASWVKRRRVDYNHHMRDSTMHHGPMATRTTATVNVPSRPKPRQRRQAEATELLIDLPPECRKGALGYNELRKQWREREIHRIYAETGVKVELRGITGNTARFVCADDQSPPSTRDQQESSSRRPLIPNWGSNKPTIANTPDLPPLPLEVIRHKKDSQNNSPQVLHAGPDGHGEGSGGSHLSNVSRADPTSPLRIYISGILSLSPPFSRPSPPPGSATFGSSGSSHAHSLPPVFSMAGTSTQPTCIDPTSPTSDYKVLSGPHQADDCNSARSLSPLAVEYVQGLSSEPIYIGPISPEPEPLSSPELSILDFIREPNTVTSVTTVAGVSSSVFKSPPPIGSMSPLMLNSIPTSPPDREIQPIDYGSVISDHHTSQHISSHTMRIEGIPTRIPTQQHDKSRRLLSLSNRSHILNISMRGTIDLFDTIPLRHRRTLRTARTSGELIDDACLLQAGNEYHAILGHARDLDQLSWCRTPTTSNQICDSRPLNRPWNNSKKGGVSAVTSLLQPLRFATGGYDHVVHLWDVKPDLSSASPRTLAIKHNSQIQSLMAIRDTSHKLISTGADCNVHIWDLASERVVNTIKTSNSPYHIHAMTSPFCTLLEVAHRELQFEVRDHRLVPEQPVQRFGYVTERLHGRFIKGDTLSDLFVSGGYGGIVRLWDLRNVKAPPVMVTCESGQKITQVIFKQSRLLVCSENGQLDVINYDNE